MRSRKWIGILALLGVLLHAGAVVRHNMAMTGATLEYQALLAGLAQLCHGAATADVLAAAELPYVPRPSDAGNDCPICSGLGPVVALAAPGLATGPVSLAPVTITFDVETRCGADSRYAVCPPARGPPAAA